MPSYREILKDDGIKEVKGLDSSFYVVSSRNLDGSGIPYIWYMAIVIDIRNGDGFGLQCDKCYRIVEYYVFMLFMTVNVLIFFLSKNMKTRSLVD